MKSLFLCFIMISTFCGLSQSTTGSNDMNFNLDRNIMSIRDPRNEILQNQTYLIKGKNVLGSPFLYNQWLPGHIETTDGKLFTNYLLKYDAYNQTLHFFDGKDSLEINEPVSRFTLSHIISNKKKDYTFEYFKKAEKNKTPLFLELLTDGSKYALYKFSKKVTVDKSRALPGTAAMEYFDLKISYYLLNKNTGELNLINEDGSNLKSFLKPNHELKVLPPDLETEEGKIRYIESENQH